jgi:ferredoxin
MRIRVDREKCQGHAQCHAISPDIYPLDDMGYVTISDLVVKPDDERSARQGALVCPERAIEILD